MRFKSKVPALVSLVAVAALSIQGMSPATATEPDAVEVPTPAATITAEDDAQEANEPEVVEEPAAPEAAEEPAEPEAPKLLDLTIGNKTSPIRLNPLTLPLNLGSIDLNAQTTATSDPQYGGSASGLTADINLAGLIKLKTIKLGSLDVKPDGGLAQRSATLFQVPVIPLPVPDLNILSGSIQGVVTRTLGSSTALDQRPVTTASVEVARLSSNVYFAYVGAGTIKSSARAERLASGQYKLTGATSIAWLEIAGFPFQTSDVAPNTTHDVPGLGTVVLNEQKITQIPGDRHGIEVHAIHITLDSAELGLPVGADIYIGSSEAIVYE